AKRAIRSYPDFPPPYRWLAAALGQLGRREEAKEALQQALAVFPDAFETNVRNRVPWMRSEDHAHMLEGLRKAGWKERPSLAVWQPFSPPIWQAIRASWAKTRQAPLGHYVSTAASPIRLSPNMADGSSRPPATAS